MSTQTDTETEPMALKNVRVPAALWRQAAIKAKRNDESLSRVIRQALRAYVAEG